MCCLNKIWRTKHFFCQFPVKRQVCVRIKFERIWKQKEPKRTKSNRNSKEKETEIENKSIGHIRIYICNSVDSLFFFFSPNRRRTKWNETNIFSIFQLQSLLWIFEFYSAWRRFHYYYYYQNPKRSTVKHNQISRIQSVDSIELLNVSICVCYCIVCIPQLSRILRIDGQILRLNNEWNGRKRYNSEKNTIELGAVWFDLVLFYLKFTRFFFFFIALITNIFSFVVVYSLFRRCEFLKNLQRFRRGELCFVLSCGGRFIFN